MGVKPLHMGESVEYEMYGILDFIEDEIDEQHFFLEEELKFHSSWDWLMPVIKKIEAKNYWFNRLDGDVSIVNDKGVIINTPMSDGGIDMYYQTVVEFIKSTNLTQQI